MLGDSLSRFDDWAKVVESMNLICANHMCCVDVLSRSLVGGTTWEGSSSRIKLISPLNELNKGKPKEEISELL